MTFKSGPDNPGFKKGQSGNPAGRPKGSRNKLGEDFIQKLYADFQEHGETVIATVRAEKPDQYLKVVASILPKELHIKDASLGDLSDDELIDAIAAIRSAIAGGNGIPTGEGTGSKKGKAGVRGKPSELH